MEGREAFLFRVSIEEGAEVQFLDHEVADEMGRVPFGNEFRDFWWQQPLPLGVPGSESLGHTFLIVQASQTFILVPSLLTPSKVEQGAQIAAAYGSWSSVRASELRTTVRASGRNPNDYCHENMR